ncbi:hypothetical protein Tco_0594343, partial [Tanacetum coccineum]
RKAQAAAKRKAEKNRGSEGAGGSEGSSKSRKEKSADHSHRDGNFNDDVDEEVDLEGPDRHVSDTTERVVIGTESLLTAATRPDNGKSIA